MKYFIATYTHPDVEGWKKHLTAHLLFIEELVKEDKIVASGPLLHTPEKSALIIFKTTSKEAAQTLIDKDPYTIHGLVGVSTLTEWNPIFGVYQSPIHRLILKLRKLFTK